MHRKYIVYIVSFAAFLGPFSQSIYIPILPEITRDFHTTPFMINLSISIFTIFLALMQIVYGPLTDSKGRRNVILFGIFLYILASLGCFYSNSVYVLLFFRALQAIGIAAGSVVAVTVIGDLFEAKDRGKAMGTFQMMVSVGPVLGPVVGGFLGGAFDFHSVFMALVCVGIIVFGFHFVFLKETKSEPGAESTFKASDFLVILKNRMGSSIIFLGFIQYYAYYSFLVFVPGILSERYGLTAGQKGLIFLPLTVAIIVGNFFGGIMQERMERRKIVVFTCFLNVSAVFLFLLVSHISLPLLVIAIALFGLFFGMSLPVQTTMLTVIFQSNRATAVGVYNFFRYMGMACGPLLGSLLLHVGGNNVLFGFVGAVFLGFALFLNRQYLRIPGN
jgi:DHA1 family bicyclomycin/chloramphenicol resistance-like MFS transporter